MLAKLGLTVRSEWAWHLCDYEIPQQGWKVHVSCIPSNADYIVSTVANHAIRFNFAYKVRSSLKNFMLISNSLGSSYSQNGKLIAIYPRDYPHFLEIISNLGINLTGIECYSVPFEARVPNTPVYYRYGAMARSDGNIVAPDGSIILDDREKYKPDFLDDPIKDLLNDPHEKHAPEPPSFFRYYTVSKALSQRGRGGNYLAFNKKTGEDVFVKEGRLLGEHDPIGLNGLTRVENESYFSRLLTSKGISTIPLKHYSRNYKHAYLVFPLMDKIDPVSLSYEHRVETCSAMIDIILKLHELGIQHNDVKIENFLITKESVYIIDLETAQHATWDQYPRGGTIGYLPRRRKVSGFLRDKYCLAVCICFLMSGLSVENRFKAGFGLRKLAEDLPKPLKSFVNKALII